MPGARHPGVGRLERALAVADQVCPAVQALLPVRFRAPSPSPSSILHPPSSSAAARPASRRGNRSCWCSIAGRVVRGRIYGCGHATDACKTDGTAQARAAHVPLPQRDLVPAAIFGRRMVWRAGRMPAAAGPGMELAAICLQAHLDLRGNIGGDLDFTACAFPGQR